MSGIPDGVGAVSPHSRQVLERMVAEIDRNLDEVSPSTRKELLAVRKLALRDLGSFENPRYEYTTREFPTKIGEVTPEFEAVLEKEGWRRAWADITVEGTFVVYRRERR